MQCDRISILDMHPRNLDRVATESEVTAACPETGTLKLPEPIGVRSLLRFSSQSLGPRMYCVSENQETDVTTWITFFLPHSCSSIRTVSG
jgi:hypothetical protein